MRVGLILTILMFGAVIGALGHAIYKGIMLPDVHFSYSTNECVEVINYMPNHNFDCDNLPFRFFHVWVE